MRNFAVVLVLITTPTFAANKTPNADLLPAGDAIRIEAPNGSAILKHPLVDKLRKEITAGEQWKTAQASPQFDRLRLIANVIEKATGKNWIDGLQQLTAGGVAVSFNPGKPNGATVVIAAKDNATIKRFESTVQEFVKSRLPESQRDHVYVPTKKAGFEFTKIGNASYAIVGNRLVFGSDEKRLVSALKLLSRKRRATTSSKTALRVAVDMKAVRKIPGVTKGLQVPAKDAGLVALLGGWMDLLRRGKTFVAELTAEQNTLDLRLRTNASYDKTTKGLKGYFADSTSQSAAPLLHLPGTIYAASWYRDYQSLWNNRRQLVTAKTVKKLEEGDDTVKQQLSVIGSTAAPSRIFSLAGPHFRVAVTRQGETDYRIKPESRLPAGVLAVGLRDEKAFRKEVTPFLKGLGLILAFEQQLQTRKSTHKKADLTTLRYADDDGSAAKGNRIRFNFATTYAITRGHFIIGSTPGIVRKTIDAIDRQATVKSHPPVAATERQYLDLNTAITALNDFEWQAIRGLVLQAGFKVDNAKAEIGRLKNFLKNIGNITTLSGFNKNGFEYRIRIGKP